MNREVKDYCVPGLAGLQIERVKTIFLKFDVRTHLLGRPEPPISLD